MHVIIIHKLVAIAIYTVAHYDIDGFLGEMATKNTKGS